MPHLKTGLVGKDWPFIDPGVAANTVELSIDLLEDRVVL